MTNKYKIEKGVPMPAWGRSVKYPFANMAVNDSVLLRGMTRSNANARVAYWKRKLGWRFVTRTVKGGVRVWRVE